MPRFSANLGFLWSDRPLLARIDAAALAGFRACEFHWPYEIPAQQLRATCREHAIEILGINTPRGDVSKREFGLAALVGREQEFRDQFDAVVDYAVACGANAIHVIAGNVEPKARMRAYDVFMNNLLYAASRVASHPINLLLEPLNERDNPGYFYSTLTEAVSLIEQLSLPNVKLQFDCYHVALTENDVLTKLERYFAHIGNVQIASVPNRAEPDEGSLYYRDIFAGLDRLGYSGYVGCEYKPRSDTDAGLKWMRSLAGE